MIKELQKRKKRKRRKRPAGPPRWFATWNETNFAPLARQVGILTKDVKFLKENAVLRHELKPAIKEVLDEELEPAIKKVLDKELRPAVK